MADRDLRISGMSGGAIEDAALPSGVRSLLKARFSTLGRDSQELVRVAAVIGRGFGLELLCAVAGRGEHEVSGALAPLINAGLISESEAGAGYYFSHDKLRQTLYEDIGFHRCRELHLRVAETLASAGREPEELAHHYL